MAEPTSPECIGHISTVDELVRELNKRRLDGVHAHWRYWFRGQARQDWSLTPGVYREEFGNFQNEDDRLNLEQNLNQQFKVMSAGLRTVGTDEDLYFLQQHYRMPTRLLDWSTSALAALYFACREKEHRNVDGKLFLMDAYDLKRDDTIEPKFKGNATSRHPVFTKAIRVIAAWQKQSEFPTHIIPVRPDVSEGRISRQHSCFTFHVPKQRTLTSDHTTTLKWFGVKENGDEPDQSRTLAVDRIDPPSRSP
jgi:hypothetical protein